MEIGETPSDARGCFVSVRGARAYLRGARAVKWDSRCKGFGYVAVHGGWLRVIHSGFSACNVDDALSVFCGVYGA